jgi:tRNA nucleotidyltransferase/poly(A) polymerase
MHQQTARLLQTPSLTNMRNLFLSRGFDLRFVGGCVRDALLGLRPHDIDLHTDANPQQQVELYQANNIRYIETGLQHGTISVVMDGNTYEVTSLRRDVLTDGRHATVEYTGDGAETLDDELLRKFQQLGYDKDTSYDVEELIRVFRQIDQ